MNPFQKEHEQLLKNQSDRKEERIAVANLVIDEIRDPKTLAHQKISKEYQNIQIKLGKNDLSPHIHDRLKIFENHQHLDSEIRTILNSIPHMQVLIVNNNSYGDFVSVTIQ